MRRAEVLQGIRRMNFEEVLGRTKRRQVSQCSGIDARALAPDMRTTPDNLLSMIKRRDVSEFALSVRNLTPHALKVSVPPGYLEGEPYSTPNSERRS